MAASRLDCSLQLACACQLCLRLGLVVLWRHHFRLVSTLNLTICLHTGAACRTKYVSEVQTNSTYFTFLRGAFHHGASPPTQ